MRALAIATFQRQPLFNTNTVNIISHILHLKAGMFHVKYECLYLQCTTIGVLFSSALVRNTSL